MPTGALYVVGTPIGNLDDLTERARTVLTEVDCVYAEDTRRTGTLLARLPGRRPDLRSLHEHNETSRIDELVAFLAEGSDCALVSDAGTPAVSDPGRRAVAAAADAGHRVVPVPGPSAVTAALSASGLSADRFVFLGFPPRSGRARDEWLERCRDATETVVFFESPNRVAGLLAEMTRAGMGERSAVLGRELTKVHEEQLRGSVRELAEALGERDLRGEVTVVLEAAPDAGWEEKEAEVRDRAREMDRSGASTQDIAGRLEEEFGVPRNVAYEIGLEVSEDG